MQIWHSRLRDGREVTFRPLTRDDAAGLADMFSTMSDEALQWGMPPYTKETVDRWMNNFDRLFPLVAVSEERIVGNVMIYRQPHPRRTGVADMGMYVHQEFHGVGLGTLLTERVLSLAEEQGLHRISLEVVEDNLPAVALYKKTGFQVEGRLIDSYFGADGRYHNSLLMARILGAVQT
jgi:putative acetyltransferase